MAVSMLAITVRNNIVKNLNNATLHFCHFDFMKHFRPLTKKQYKALATFTYNRFASSSSVHLSKSLNIPTDLEENITSLISQLSSEMKELLPAYKNNLTMASVVKEPHHFLSILHNTNQYLQRYNDEQMRLANEVQTEATTGYIISLLKQLDAYKVLGKRRRSRVHRNVLKRINGDAPMTIDPAWNLNDEVRTQIAEIITHPYTKRQHHQQLFSKYTTTSILEPSPDEETSTMDAFQQQWPEPHYL
ncbi:uncharacterized protein BYT42DRAFT_543624 [Radiomyces spectabilis]|uniref:uncharacterized protein n=1 Tax=Radiomyces spectabilis TaxID=64574 RepID=UPI002220934B|nr:uncharacterized protein BYT42DRAFT_543624 [Radiomyces spectabilis]KAI8388297.1 hypothetical protein BYT42DRAFT_543624 [Radiomyces spectabilis]